MRVRLVLPNTTKETPMNKNLRFILPATLALVTGVAAAGSAEYKAPSKPIKVEDKITMKATVEAVDHTNRLLTLKGEKGNELTLEVDPAVHRFDQIEVGDTVTVNYYESLIAEVLKPGDATVASSVSTEASPKEGVKPAGGGVVKETMTVTIEAIDLATPAVTIKKPDGTVVSFRVQHKKNLEQVKVGDRVVVTRITGVAVDVTGPKS